jgi:hypothetical protein
MAINPYVPATAVGNGTQVDFTFTFPYIFPAHVTATINDVATTAFTFFSSNILRFNTPPANGATVRIFRETPADTLAAVIQPGGPLPIIGLNNNFLQSLYYNQETQYDAANQSTAGLQAQIDGITVTSNTALATAGSAVTTANAATATANGIAGTANTALSNSTAAVATANAAQSTANAALPQTGGTLTGNLTVPSINGGQLAGFRNRIINGNFDLWQRGTSFTDNEYGADRWIHGRVGTTHTVTRQAFTLGQTAVPGEPVYFCRTVVSSVAGAANYAALAQRIEDVRTFAGQQVTVSFWAKVDSTKNIAMNMVQTFGTGGSPSANVGISGTKVSIGTTFQKVTVTATLPSISGKTLGSDNNSYLQLLIWFDAGSTRNGDTDSLGQQSGTFDIAQVQIEPGPIATPFERRPIGTELALCQRYYESGDIILVPTVSGTAQILSFATRKRSTPTITLVAGAGSGATLAAVGNQGIYQNNNHSIYTGGNLFTASAEL